MLFALIGILTLSFLFWVTKIASLHQILNKIVSYSQVLQSKVLDSNSETSSVTQPVECLNPRIHFSFAIDVKQRP